jgi:hypothetical protein
MRVNVAILAFSAFLCLVTPVHAEETAPLYAVVAIEVAGDADPTLRAQVQAGLVRGVNEAGADLLGYDDVQKLLSGKAALVGCLSTTCLSSIADVVGTTQMLQVRVSATGANYDVELTLLDPSGPVRRRTGSCTVCTVADLSELTATRILDLLTAEPDAPLPVEIATQPGGASLLVPGADGPQEAPWTGALPPGTHVIEAHKDGYEPARREITVVDDGSEQRFQIELTPAKKASARRRFGWMKWATAGVSLGALVTGGILIGMHGNPTCDASNATCPREYSTGTAGAVIGIVGLAGAGAAGWMFWSDRRAGQESVGASYAWRF